MFIAARFAANTTVRSSAPVSALRRVDCAGQKAPLPMPASTVAAIAVGKSCTATNAPESARRNGEQQQAHGLRSDAVAELANDRRRRNAGESEGRQHQPCPGDRQTGALPEVDPEERDDEARAERV